MCSGTEKQLDDYFQLINDKIDSISLVGLISLTGFSNKLLSIILRATIDWLFVFKKPTQSVVPITSVVEPLIFCRLLDLMLVGS